MICLCFEVTLMEKIKKKYWSAQSLIYAVVFFAYVFSATWRALSRRCFKLQLSLITSCLNSFQRFIWSLCRKHTPLCWVNVSTLDVSTGFKSFNFFLCPPHSSSSFRRLCGMCKLKAAAFALLIAKAFLCWTVCIAQSQNNLSGGFWSYPGCPFMLYIFLLLIFCCCSLFHSDICLFCICTQTIP